MENLQCNLDITAIISYFYDILLEIVGNFSRNVQLLFLPSTFILTFFAGLDYLNLQYKFSNLAEHSSMEFDVGNNNEIVLREFAFTYNCFYNTFVGFPVRIIAVFGYCATLHCDAFWSFLFRFAICCEIFRFSLTSQFFMKIQVIIVNFYFSDLMKKSHEQF